MVHNEIHTIDLLIIAAYLIAMVLIGLVVVRKVRNMDDYYLGGRSFGPLVLMATVCATIIGGSGLMGRAGVAYSSGFKAIMTALPYLLGMFIFSGFAGGFPPSARRLAFPPSPTFRAALRQEREGHAWRADCFYDDGHGRLSGYGDGDNHQHARKRNRHLL